MHFYKDDYQFISIHALREEGDCIQAFPPAAHQNFYPRPPRGGRHTIPRKHNLLRIFLSTPSARRATPVSCSVCAIC